MPLPETARLVPRGRSCRLDQSVILAVTDLPGGKALRTWHSPKDRDALMAWAGEDVFCFVLYFKQGTAPADQEAVGRWTRELIDHVLRHEGRYYLPYQLHATHAQFEAAYPQAGDLRRLKRQHDPAGKFSNELWRRYL